MQATRIREAEATLASAAAQASWTQSDFERYSRLAERRNASEQTLGQARVDADRARAAVAAAEASLEAARDQIAVIDAARATAEAERAMAQAALELARIDLEHATLRAPIDGVIGNKRVQVGDYLKVGQQLMTIVPLDELYVEANFKETQLAGMRVGDEVRLEVDAYPETAARPARSRAWPRPRARPSACCRPRTPPATSPRSCSACRCGSGCR